MNPYQVGDFVRCIDAAGAAEGMLVAGQVYEVVGLNGMDVHLHAHKLSWNERRFEKVEQSPSSKPGEKGPAKLVRCRLPTSCAAQFHEGQAVYCSGAPETRGCPHRDSDTDLGRLKSILDLAQTGYRSWDIKEYITRGGDVVDFEGIVLVHGAQDDGPYTEYIFDRQGRIIPNGVTSLYQKGLDILEKA